MDVEFTKWLATLGIGGVLAGFMFVFYRKDIKQYSELWRTTTAQLLDVVNQNTVASIKLINTLENLEHNSVTISDLKEFCRWGAKTP